MRPAPDLLARRLLFFTGKGGVGKSTVTAATALLAAERGQRVLSNAAADPPHDRLHATAPVARAEVGRRSLRQRRYGLVPDLRRTRPEAAVRGQQFGRKTNVAHKRRLLGNTSVHAGF